MRKLSAIFVLALLVASCGTPPEQATVQWYLKSENPAPAQLITLTDNVGFEGKNELKMAWENTTGFKEAQFTEVAGGYVVSEGEKSLYLDSKTGKSEKLPDGCIAGVTDGTTVWAENGSPWSIKDRKPVWATQMKMEPKSAFTIADGCLLLIGSKQVSRIDQTNGKKVWTLELSTGAVGKWTVTKSFLFIEGSGWIFRISPSDGQYVFVSKNSEVKELFGAKTRFVSLADEKMMVYEEFYSTPILTMGQSNKKIQYLWLSNDSMLILTETGYHFGKLPTNLDKETQQTFKSFTYNAKNNKMIAFTQVVGAGDNFAVVQGNLVACIGPDVKKDIWYFQLSAPKETDFLPRILSLTKPGVLVFYKGKASLWH